MIEYEMRLEKGAWVVRTDGRRVVGRSKFEWLARRKMVDAARHRALAAGETVVYRQHSPTEPELIVRGEWTPESAREYREAIDDICRRALSPKTDEGGNQ